MTVPKTSLALVGPICLLGVKTSPKQAKYYNQILDMVRHFFWFVCGILGMALW